MSELLEKIRNIIIGNSANGKLEESDLARIDSELQMLEDEDILSNVLSIYQTVNAGSKKTGTENKLNSAVAYFLGITSKKHNVSNPMVLPKRRTYGRVGFPDIDMDIDYERRYLIDEYLIKKYGAEYVAKIGVRQQLKTKAAVRRTIKILDPDNNIVFDREGKKVKDNKSENYQLEQRVLSTLPEMMKRPDGTFINTVKAATEEYELFRRYMEQYPEVYRFSRNLEGALSSYGCIAKDTLILTDGGWVRVDQLNKSMCTAYLNKAGDICFSSSCFAHRTGHKQLYEMKLVNGDSVKLTDEHLVFTDQGCVEFRKIRENPEQYKILSVGNNG